MFSETFGASFMSLPNVLHCQAQINDSSVGRYVVTVGSNNYYLPYNVKIQAFNPMGRGPMSPMATIMSAEERK